MSNVAMIAGMLGMVDGVGVGLQRRDPPPMRGDIRQQRSPRYSSAGKCHCGKTISANKRFCWACAIEEAKKAGLLK